MCIHAHDLICTGTINLSHTLESYLRKCSTIYGLVHTILCINMTMYMYTIMSQVQLMLALTLPLNEESCTNLKLYTHGGLFFFHHNHSNCYQSMH